MSNHRLAMVRLPLCSTAICLCTERGTNCLVLLHSLMNVFFHVCLPNPCRGGCFSMQTARYGLPVDLVSMIDTERTGV